MSKKSPKSTEETLLDLWKAPLGAGGAVGCLASTYTFHAELFDQYCLQRFLGIDTDPDREDLAYLLERESLLAQTYAGVLVDRGHAGVEHSLRWDVLPVSVPRGIQHAKVSVLSWANHVRAIVGSANLTDPGYRTNREVMAVVDFTPEDCDQVLLIDLIAFLTDVVGYVSGAEADPPHVLRATAFLVNLTRRTATWVDTSKRSSPSRVLVTTMPDRENDANALGQCIALAKRSRRALRSASMASPFFDKSDARPVISTLLNSLTRGGERSVFVAVPALVMEDGKTAARLAAPKAIFDLATEADVDLTVAVLPQVDGTGNARAWHAKMLQLESDDEVGLLAGSSNFTAAGMGVGHRTNIEANLFFLVPESDRAGGRSIEGLWDGCEILSRPEDAEWLGSNTDEEEVGAPGILLPKGFLVALFVGGTPATLMLRIDPSRLPAQWTVAAVATTGTERIAGPELLNASGSEQKITFLWTHANPPVRLLVQLESGEAIDWPINVSDPSLLPPPAEFATLTAEEMLRLLAASDPGAALRSFARRRGKVDGFDSELDDAVPIELDPLRRYDLGQTFLHTIRRRARLFARYRTNLQGPVLSQQALTSRLEGLLSAQALVSRFVSEMSLGTQDPDRNLLVIADLLLVLADVDYQETPNALSRKEFMAVYRPFLKQLATDLNTTLLSEETAHSSEVRSFFEAATARCAR